MVSDALTILAFFVLISIKILPSITVISHYIGDVILLRPNYSVVLYKRAVERH
ncbi:MAG: hypothetical protein AB9856_10625 [Cellulosilyticaceae bacterium]